ncbi:MAG: hypothetical protein H7296_12595 [Bacteroidia bacterium]|nr:hypothetical protein [Bacteroidia bacterium]
MNQLLAQKILADTVGIKITKVPMADPKKATLYSLIPGGGQIYNKKYWKVPVIYVGFGLLTYSFIFYNEEYNRVRTAYKQKLNNEPITDPEFANVPEETLLRTRESYGKSRDLSIIAMAGIYVLNLVDAAVDAHLKGFDVSDKLSLKIKPSYNYSLGNTYVALNFKLCLK